jgi:hypothetical protein
MPKIVALTAEKVCENCLCTMGNCIFTTPDPPKPPDPVRVGMLSPEMA